jgi:hypothetical protein
VQWDCIPASAVGANHQRDRLWIVGHAISGGRGGEPRRRPGPEPADGHLGMEARDVADAKRRRGDGLHERLQPGHLAADLGGSSPHGALGPAAPDHGRGVPRQRAQGGDDFLAVPGRRGRHGRPDQQGKEEAERGRPGPGGEKMAHTQGRGLPVRGKPSGNPGHPDFGGPNVADAQGQPLGAGLRQSRTSEERRGRFSDGRGPARWWTTEPRLGRVAHGVAHRVDRLKAIGNGQVPAVVKAFLRLMEAG